MTPASTPPPLWPDACDRLVDALQTRLGPRRFLHSLGVLQTALGLAHAHGVAREAVAWAALLHDLCKAESHEEQRRQAEKLGEMIPPEDLECPGLWHAWAAAGVARQEWGLSDPDILDAIRHHSTGHPAMGPVTQILLVADLIEPTRGHPQAAALVAQAHRSLRAAAAETLRLKVEHMRGEGKRIHPRALATLEALTESTQEVSSSTPAPLSASSPSPPRT